MPNPDIGEIHCPTCEHVAPVRKSVKDKLYFVCSTCGLFPMAYPGGQDWILNHATFYGPSRPADDPPEDPPADPGPAPAPKPDPEPEPQRASGKSAFEDWLP